ncbi:MAG TPA: serine/threonine-protein kinase [Kofleriaceae bacterium]
MDGLATVPDDAGDRSGAGPGARSGTMIGRFLVEGVLGTGGMGVVLAAYDPELDRKVALKLLAARPDPRWAEARIGEARAMAQLAHPNVVTVHEAGIVDATPYLVMELVAGGTLRSWIAEPHDWREVLAMMCAAGAGLAAAHRAGVVHRDFKPENVLVGGDGRPRVSDFGLASHGATPGRGGTRGYMAPEQRAGALVDARADQYAFCVTLAEALRGSRPRARPTPAWWDRAMRRGPRAVGRAPAWLDRAVQRGLRAEPG